MRNIGRLLLAFFTFVTSGLAGIGCTSLHSTSQVSLGFENFNSLPVSGQVESSLETTRMVSKVGTGGMVVSADTLASQWGAEILRKGGNAVDAAVATALVLAVTRPDYASLGGGGFFLYCPQSQRCSALDYREKAPLAAYANLYIKDGQLIPDVTDAGALASGVPGVVAGLTKAQKAFGKLPFKLLISRAIELAEKGVVMSGLMESGLKGTWEHANGEFKNLFGCSALKDGAKKPCPVGVLFVQKDLARVLKEISQWGHEGFYGGWVAKKIVEEMKKSGGIFTLDDFKKYDAKWREPLRKLVFGREVMTMPPSSSGGVALLQMLEYLEVAEKNGLLREGFGSLDSIHSMTHAMALAFSDRTTWLGDSDFVKVPIQELISEEYLEERWEKTFKNRKANIPQEPSQVPGYESEHTTHLSVVDAMGNAVAITTTDNSFWGSGVVPAGTGVVMNNQMDDFSVQPGVPNQFGLVANRANAIASEKRPLSSMTPTIVRDQEMRTQLVLGAAGGPGIVCSIFQVLANRIIFGMPLGDALAVPRIQHQWKPNVLSVERFSFPVETLRGLYQMGYELQPKKSVGQVQAIERFSSGRVWGAADPRSEGVAIAQ